MRDQTQRFRHPILLLIRLHLLILIAFCVRPIDKGKIRNVAQSEGNHSKEIAGMAKEQQVDCPLTLEALSDAHSTPFPI